MGARPSSYWQKIIQHPVAIGVVGVILLVVIALIIAGYWFDWTGFDGYNQVTIAHTVSGPSAGTVVRTDVYQPGKSLWDWLQLLGVLAIPVVVGFGAVWFTAQLGKASDRRNSLEQMKNQKIVENQFQQALLQSYLDRMSELLLEKNLRQSLEKDEVRKVARARTLATLLSLDGVHKGNLLQFLSESGLIDRNRSVIDLLHADLSSTNLHGAVLQSTDLVGTNLSQADMSDAYLSQANLNQANLSEADLYGANLSGADLSGADLKAALLEIANLEGANLEGANLEMANLFGANLRRANLRGALLRDAMIEDDEVWIEVHSLQGATMPDGTIHP